MAYYSDSANSREGQVPDAVALPSFSEVTWETGTEQAPIKASFADGNYFEAWGLSHGPPGTQSGQGANKYSDFTCYRDADELLFVADSTVNCYSIYSCSHVAPDFLLLSTQPSLSSEIVTVTNGVDPNTALHHFFDDVNSSGGCNGNTYDIGDKCNIQFTTCRFPNSATSNAIGTYLTQVIAPKIPNTQSTYVPTQCTEYQCTKFGPGPNCACDKTPIPYTTQSWPSSGDITIYITPENDPSASAIHAEFTFRATCPPPPGCNSALCNSVAGAISALGAVDPELAPISIFGALLGVGCQECT
jgi:hypothetical protein